MQKGYFGPTGSLGSPSTTSGIDGAPRHLHVVVCPFAPLRTVRWSSGATRQSLRTHVPSGKVVVGSEVEGVVVVDVEVAPSPRCGSAPRMKSPEERPAVKIGTDENGLWNVAPPSRLKADLIVPEASS